ncbi:MAG: hypothetical protein OEW16_02605 [Gammaproteobacteria bacterium]|nr:hypothetical protein [Gammaproteobacteria bacterium]
MFPMYTSSKQMAVSALAAFAIVSLHAVVLDQGHIASAPRGTVEVGELTLVSMAPMASVTLPEVTVVAKRESANGYFAVAAELPEVVVVAKRVAYMVANANAAEQAGSASAKGSAESVLLK